MAKLRGLDQVMTRLNEEVSTIKGRTLDGLMAGGLIVQGEAQRRVPVEHGTLRASAYTRKSPRYSLAIEVGFSAAYAVFVHENMEAKWRGKPRRSGLGVYWGPAGEPRYLANAVTAKHAEVVSVVASRAKKSSVA